MQWSAGRQIDILCRRGRLTYRVFLAAEGTAAIRTFKLEVPDDFFQKLSDPKRVSEFVISLDSAGTATTKIEELGAPKELR